MKKSIISAAIFAAALFPQVASAAEEAGGERGSCMLLGFFAINFALFAFVLVYFAAPLARKFFSDRATMIRNGFSRANSALTEAQDLANNAAARMAALEAELKQVAAELEQETAFQAAKIREIAAATAARVRRDTELGSSAIADNAQRRVREKLAVSAATLARELITRHFERADQGRLIEGFMDKLGEGARR